ncbi:hypothetical protein vBEcoMWL3_gp188c [Escherichia phage vB_EcoM_WL-3]|nr:hypothetical protein vBEcoMWL3_gp188c [Escherichia phage vB_EcoM_WL-3]
MLCIWHGPNISVFPSNLDVAPKFFTIQIVGFETTRTLVKLDVIFSNSVLFLAASSGDKGSINVERYQSSKYPFISAAY